MKKSTIPIVLLLLALAVLAGSCSAILENRATVSLDLSAWTIPAPRTLLPTPLAPVLASIELSVSGPDMETVHASFPASSTEVTISVPSGPSRTISLSAEALPGPSPISRRYGETVADLVPGRNEITLRTTFETKIIVPVPTVFDGTVAIRQFDDISGANPMSNFDVTKPYDIDFDSSGRIYIAGSGATESVFCVDRIDPAVAPVGLATLPAGPEDSIAIAIDRANGLLYHVTRQSAGQYFLYRMSLSETDSLTDALVTMPAAAVVNTGSTGLAVDEAGMLYILANDGAGLLSVIRLDPTTPTATVLASRTIASIPELSGLTTAFDLMVKNSRVYLSAYLYSASPSGVVLELSLALDSRRTYGGTIPVPLRFLAIMNRKFHLIDEFDDQGNNLDRLVAFDDFGDTSLDILAPGDFAFFLSC